MNRYQEWDDLKKRYEINDIRFSELVERASAMFFHHDETKFLLRILEDVGSDLNITLVTIRAWRSGQVIPNFMLRKLVIGALDVAANECLNKDANVLAGQLIGAASILMSRCYGSPPDTDLLERIGGTELVEKMRNIADDLTNMTHKYRTR